MNADVTPPAVPSDTDWLEVALRHDAREHLSSYVDDQGFSARVMSALPAPVVSLPRWRRPALVALWSAAAAGAAFALPGIALDVGREAFRVLAAQPVSLPQIAGALLAVGVVTWSGAAWALRSE